MPGWQCEMRHPPHKSWRRRQQLLQSISRGPLWCAAEQAQGRRSRRGFDSSGSCQHSGSDPGVASHPDSRTCCRHCPTHGCGSGVDSARAPEATEKTARGLIARRTEQNKARNEAQGRKLHPGEGGDLELAASELGAVQERGAGHRVRLQELNVRKPLRRHAPQRVRLGCCGATRPGFHPRRAVAEATARRQASGGQRLRHAQPLSRLRRQKPLRQSAVQKLAISQEQCDIGSFADPFKFKYNVSRASLPGVSIQYEYEGNDRIATRSACVARKTAVSLPIMIRSQCSGARCFCHKILQTLV